MQSQSYIKTYADQTDEEMYSMFRACRDKEIKKEKAIARTYIIKTNRKPLEIDPYDYYQANKDNLY